MGYEARRQDTAAFGMLNNRIALLIVIGIIGLALGLTPSSVTQADGLLNLIVPEMGNQSLEGDPYSLEGDGQTNATHTASTQWAVNRMQVALAHAQGARGAGVVVAVIDTGINTSHPYLAGRMTQARRNFVPGRSSYDVTDAPDGDTNHQVGHGTFIAGLVLQVAPNARVMPVRVLNGDGNGTDNQVADGIRYAINNGADVINLSMGTLDDSLVLRLAIQEALLNGVIVVASAGNQASERVTYPGAYNGVIAVAATDEQDHKAAFSNYHRTIALSAPGVGLYSTYANGGWAWGSGTSFAAALVSGEMAVLDSLYPSNQVRNRAYAGGQAIDTLNPAYAQKLGRRVDLFRALTLD